MPRRGQNGGKSTQSSSLAALKLSLFGVFHMMREKAERQPSSTQQLFAVSLIFIDSLQVLALPMISTFGWSKPTVDVFAVLGALDVIIPAGPSRAVWYTVMYILALLLVVIAIATAAYVANMFHTNNVKQLWALRFLRAVVGIIITAGFVPLTRFTCFGLQHIAQGALSVIMLLAYIPFGLTCSLVFHEGNSAMPSITAKVSGKEAMLGTIAKLIGIAMVYAATQIPKQASLVMTVCYLWLTTYTATTLPFYHRPLNSFKCAASFGTAIAWLGAFILVSLPDGADITLFSAVWMGAVLPVALAAGASLPLLQYARIRRILEEVRPRMLEALREHHSRASTLGMVESEHKSRLRHIVRLAQAIRRVQVRTRQAMHTLSASRADTRDEGGEITPFHGLHGFEVELIIREEMAVTGPARQQRGCRGFRRRLLARVPRTVNTEVVEHVLWLFMEAAQEFADSRAELAEVKIEYAKFLQVFTADTSMAMEALEEAARQSPSIEGEFDIFSRQRALIQKRQSHNLGTEHSMNMIQLLEYSKGMHQALKDHQLSLRNLSTAMALVLRHRTREANGESEASEGMQERLGGCLERMALHAKHAGRTYRKLLAAHPTAPYLSVAYARFCHDVLNDPKLAEHYSSQTSSAASAAKSTKSSSSDGPSSTVNVLLDAPTRRSRLPRSSTGDITRMASRYRVLMWLWAFVTLASLIVSRVSLDRIDNTVQPLVDAGDLSIRIVQGCSYARRLALGDSSEALLQLTASTAKEITRLVANVQDVVVGSDVEQLWSQPDLEVLSPDGLGGFAASAVNLRDAVTDFATDLTSVAEQAASPQWSYAQALASSEWRFVMMNGVLRILPRVRQAVRQKLDSAEVQQLEHRIALRPLYIAAGLLLIIISLVVAIPACRRIRVRRGRLMEVAALLSNEEVRAIREKCKRGMASVKETRAKVQSTINETGNEDDLDEERGLGYMRAEFDEHADTSADEASLVARRSTTSRSNDSHSHSAANAFLATPRTPRSDDSLSREEGVGADLGKQGVRFTLPPVLNTRSLGQLGGAEGEHGMPLPGAPEKPLNQSLASLETLEDYQLSVLVGASKSTIETPSAAQASAMTRLGSEGGEGGVGAELTLTDSWLAQDSAKFVVPSLREILGGTPAALVCTNEVGDIVWANDALQTVLGYVPSYMIGHNVTAFQDVATAAAHKGHMMRAVAGHHRILGKPGRKVMAVSHSGHQVPVLLSVAQLRLGEGQKQRTMFIADMHKLGQEEDELDHEAAGHGHRHRGGRRAVSCTGRLSLLLKLICAMYMIINFSVLAVVLTATSVSTLTGYAVEVAVAQHLQMDAHYTVLASLETVVGDGVVWTGPGASADASLSLMNGMYAQHRRWLYGSEVGEEDRRASLLVKSLSEPVARARLEHDLLQFGLEHEDHDDLHGDGAGDVAAEHVDLSLGIVGRMFRMKRFVLQLAASRNRTFNASGVVSSWQAAKNDTNLAELLELTQVHEEHEDEHEDEDGHGHAAELMDPHADSEHGDEHSSASLQELLVDMQTLSTDLLRSATFFVGVQDSVPYILLLIAGWVTSKLLFRRLAGMLINMARRPEYLLLVLPLEMSEKGSPASHFFRRIHQ